MKVCIFAGSYASDPKSGGGHTFESEILKTIVELAPESKHQFVLFQKGLNPIQDISSRSIQENAPNQVSKAGLSHTIFQTVNAAAQKLRPAISQIGPLRQWYEKFKLNSLISNNVDITLALSPSCLTMDVPYITIVWDLEYRRQPYFPELSVAGEWNHREKFYETVLRRASIIVTGTHAGKFEIERFFQVAPERIKVLPFPTPQFALDTFNVNVTVNEHQILEKYHLPANYLFYPAQFWPHKNHVGLLFAAKWLRDKFDLIFPIVFVGSDKGNQAHVKQMADQLGLSQQVHFLGFVSQEDLVCLYRKAFALTFVTFCGPDNLPPLEAMALGCPVISSNVPGAQEQLGDAALLVDPKETEAIALAIKSLNDDGALRESLVEKGLVRANQWIAKDYVKGIFSILDEFETIRRCWN